MHPRGYRPGLTVTDSDSPTLNHATVRVATNYTIGEDLLGFTDQLGITGSWDAATGTLTLTGSASAADYQTALRSVSYQNLSDNPGTTSHKHRVLVNDGVADSAVASRGYRTYRSQRPTHNHSAGNTKRERRQPSGVFWRIMATRSSSVIPTQAPAPFKSD